MPNNASLHQLTSQVESLKLGLQNGAEFEPCAISLTPYKLTQAQWDNALTASAALAKLITRVAANKSWLHHNLQPLSNRTPSGKSLIGYLLAEDIELSNNNRRLAQDISIIRNDFLLNTQGDWQLVESNAIAAGMGPFCEVAQQLQDPAQTFAPNPSTQSQSQILFDAAAAISGDLTPLIVFVVDANEDNVFDHQYLDRALASLGARVLHLTLSQLNKSVSTQEQRLVLPEQGSIDLLYYRTGYNIEDYLDEHNNIIDLIHFRAHTETHRVAVCPSIAEQLATSKWAQMNLSAMSQSQLVSSFNLSSDEASIIERVFSSEYKMPDSPAQVKRLLASGEWLLKDQSEGGGSVYDFLDENTRITPGQILMKKIATAIRPETVEVLRDNQISTASNVCSELGIFSLGLASCLADSPGSPLPNHESVHTYGGYLLRSKPSHCLETGVHRGSGMLDTVVITPRAR